MKRILAALILAIPFAGNALAQEITTELPADSVADPYARFQGMSLTDVYNEGARHYNKRKYAQALECFKYAADNGLADAYFITGEIYYKGQTGTIDNDQAIKYWTLDADRGSGKAQFFLGVLYLGIGDGINAIKYSELAADNGFPQAKTNIGKCYDEGFGGVDYDEEKALYWFTLAAEDGDETGAAAYNIGLYYELGKAGLAVDIDKAIEWYTKAWSMGLYDAKDAISRLKPEE